MTSLIMSFLWFLIGAIINPSSYLPYASAAATFVSAISSKLAELKKLEKNVLEKVQELLLSFTNNNIGTLILSSSGDNSNNNNV